MLSLVFAGFCDRLFWLSHPQSFYNRFFLNVNRLSDSKIALLTKIKNGIICFDNPLV